jgi:hypothetical protein
MIHDAISRAICCPGGTCVKPEDCDRGKRTTVVNIPLATEAVIRVYGDQVRHRWRELSEQQDAAIHARQGHWVDR